ncbi:MAG: AAA family ATPase, partial [Bacteroidota bacterium]
KRQIIFYGPSGTDKTFMAQQLARGLTDGTDGIVQLVQFHAGYTYDKFIGTGQKPGDFHKFCTKAAQRTGPSVLIIDEINRADLGAVFGELLAQLDRETDNSLLIKQQAFSVPSNVFIIGTMVPGKPVGLFSDSVARRRFALIPLLPNYDALRHFHRDTDFQVDGLVRTLNQINSLVENPRYLIGITYFLRKDLSQHIEEIWRFEVEPCIEEAFYNDVEKVESFRWNKMKRRLTR